MAMYPKYATTLANGLLVNWLKNSFLYTIANAYARALYPTFMHKHVKKSSND